MRRIDAWITGLLLAPLFALSAWAGNSFEAGAAKKVITPNLDRETVYLGGFSINRTATGVHDDLYARAVAVGSGDSLVCLVSLDLVGLMHPDVRAVREKVKSRRPDLEPMPIVIASTHNHSSPDTVGLWGPSPGVSGYSQNYRKFLLEAIADTVVEAADSRRSAELRFGESETDGLIRDTIPPEVIIEQVLVMQAVEAESGQGIANVVLWHNHPEALGGGNRKITADFPKWVVDYTEEALGGTTVYFSGAIGGLMAPLGVRLTDPETGERVEGETFRHAEVMGIKVGEQAVAALEGRPFLESGPIRYLRKEVFIPMRNPIFRLAAGLGAVKRDVYTDGELDASRESPRERAKTDSMMEYALEAALGMDEIRGFLERIERFPILPAGKDILSEVNVIEIGPALFATVPGEIYPELVNGNYPQDADPNVDFPDAPLEPPLWKLMESYEYRFVIGLGNDLLGYIIPKRQWDVFPPFSYGRESQPYTETMSIGPEAAMIINRGIEALIEAAAAIDRGGSF